MTCAGHLDVVSGACSPSATSCIIESLMHLQQGVVMTSRSCCLVSSWKRHEAKFWHAGSISFCTYQC